MQLGITIDPGLAQFLETVLPAALRRMRGWRRHAGPGELAEDLRHELIADWLDRREQLAQLSAAERSRYWLRLLSRLHYRDAVRAQRARVEVAELDALPAPEARAAPAPAPRLGQFEQERLARLAATRCELRNGRLNVQRSAAAAGLSPRELRRLWQRVAGQLGYGEEFLRFWQRRLVEALLGLTCDLLRDRGLVRLCDEPRRTRPDPAGRLRRIRRIRDVLSVCPLPAALRGLFARYAQPAGAQQLDPRLTIADAQTLAPDDPAVLLWSFEVAVAHGQLRAASWMLRRMPRLGVPAVRWWLARARLLEARGRLPAAAALIARKLCVSPRDLRLQAVAAALRAGQACSAASSASRSSCSSRGSPRAGLQAGSPSRSNRSTETSTTTASSLPSR